MPTMTAKNDQSVADFIAAVDHKTRHPDAVTLGQMFRGITGWQPQMGGAPVIRYGAYAYPYYSGYSRTSFAPRFRPPQANQVLYIMPGYQDYGPMMDKLGKHKLGKACLYINKLADVDLDVLAQIIRDGVTDLSKKWPVTPT